ncbi:MAG: helix-turn-helix domain-containing protein [Planctomycetota bacterium]
MQKENQVAAPLAVSRRDAAHLLGISVRTLQDLTKAGKVKSFRVGVHHRYRVAELQRYMVAAEKAASRKEAQS